MNIACTVYVAGVRAENFSLGAQVIKKDGKHPCNAIHINRHNYKTF